MSVSWIAYGLLLALLVVSIAGIPIALILALMTIKVIDQYEKAIKFRLGKFVGILEPGLNFVIPLIERIQKIDLRVETVDVSKQEALTKDNVPVSINAVIFFKVVNPEKAVLQVADYRYAISQYAQTALRDVIGENDLDKVLAERDRLAQEIQRIVDKASGEWGIDVVSVKMQDIELPQDLKRTMAKVAETERERKSLIIKAEGEKMASKNYAEAARILSDTPGGLHLRTLQTLNDVSSDESNTIVFVTPVEILDAITSMTRGKGKGKK